MTQTFGKYNKVSNIVLSVPLLRHVHNLDPNAKQNTKTEVFVFWKLKNIRRHYRNIKLICIFIYYIFNC